MTTATLDMFNEITLLDLLEERAALLDASLRDHYEPGFERQLARELIAGLSAGQCTAALRILAHDKMRDVIAIDCLLDECDQGSYVTADGMASMLLAEIAAQDRETSALERLVGDEICQRQKLIAFARTERQT